MQPGFLIEGRTEVGMSTPSHSEKEFFTYADYKLWPDEERWEIIDGEPYNMSPDAWPSRSQSDRPGPAPGVTHQKVLGEIYRQIHNFLEDKPFDVFLPEPGESEDETSTVVQPDISVICDEAKLSEKGCTGPPELVIEVVSPSGASRDQIKKRRLYEKKGVAEYWIVHPSDKLLWKYVLFGLTEEVKMPSPEKYRRF